VNRGKSEPGEEGRRPQHVLKFGNQKKSRCLVEARSYGEF